MRQPGVEVRPLKQITGRSQFSEVFMTNARADKADLIGKLNEGWEIAQTTLGYERGGNSLGRVTRYTIAFDQLVKATKQLRRNGRPLLDDPVVRAKMARLYTELEVQRYAGLRVLSALEKGDVAGRGVVDHQALLQRVREALLRDGQEILGPYGQVMTARRGVRGHRLLVGRARHVGLRVPVGAGGTIYSGSSEIQKNVIGERVLGLPKEVRADRLKA